MIVDIIVIALILLGAFNGYKKGLVGILIGLIAVLLSLILAFALQIPVSSYLYNNTPIGEGLNNTITSGINEAFENSKDTENKTEEQNFYTDIVKNITTEEQIAQMSENVTMFILKGASFIIVFIVVLVICYILRMVLNLVFDLPILHSINKIGGVAAGLIKSLLSIWIILALVSIVSPIQMFDGVVILIKNTTVTNFLYTNNILVNILGSGLKIK